MVQTFHAALPIEVNNENSSAYTSTTAQLPTAAEEAPYQPTRTAEQNVFEQEISKIKEQFLSKTETYESITQRIEHMREDVRSIKGTCEQRIVQDAKKLYNALLLISPIDCNADQKLEQNKPHVPARISEHEAKAPQTLSSDAIVNLFK